MTRGFSPKSSIARENEITIHVGLATAGDPQIAAAEQGGGSVNSITGSHATMGRSSAYDQELPLRTVSPVCVHVQ